MSMFVKIVTFGLLVVHTFCVVFLMSIGLHLFAILVVLVGSVVLTGLISMLVEVYVEQGTHETVDELPGFECYVDKAVRTDGLVSLMVKTGATNAKCIVELECALKDLPLLGLEKGNLVKGRVKCDIL